MRGLLLIFLLVGNGYANAQLNEDSLRALINQHKGDRAEVDTLVYLGSQQQSHDSALWSAQQGQLLAKKLAYRKGEADRLLILQGVYAEQGNFSQAIQSNLNALVIYDELKDYTGIALAHGMLQANYRDLGDYRKSLDHAFVSLQVAEAHNVKGSLKKGAAAGAVRRVGNHDAGPFKIRTVATMLDGKIRAVYFGRRCTRHALPVLERKKATAVQWLPAQQKRVAFARLQVLYKPPQSLFLPSLSIHMKQLFVTLAFCLPFILCCTNSSSQNSEAASPAAGEGKLYLRTYYWAMNNTMEISWLWLGKDGVLVKNPKHGTNPVNVAEEKKDNSANVGRYMVKNDQMQVTWDGGSKETWLVQKKGNDFSALNKGVVTVVKPVEPGFRFEKSFSATTFLEAENSLHSIEFHKDGTVQFRKFDLYDSSIPNGTKGTYSINKNMLSLQFENGKKAVANIATINFSASMPKTLIINTTYQDL